MNNERLREYLKGRIAVYEKRILDCERDEFKLAMLLYEGRIFGYEDVLFYLEQVELGQDTKS